MTLQDQFSPHGNLNPNVRGMGQSATLAINEHSLRLRREGREIIRLGLGQSPFPVPPVVVDELRRHAHRKAYLPVKGLPELREAVAQYYRRTEGLAYSAEHVLIGPGTKELMFLVQLVYDGDLVIPAPSWVSYAPQARIIGRRVRWLPTDLDSGLGVTAEELELLCREDPKRPRLLIMNYPSNPTGATYCRQQLEAIAAVAKKYSVLVLSDEIYSGLHFTGEHVSIARFYPEGTIVSNGLSKWCGAGGWRVGAFVFPRTLLWLLDAMAAVASETYTSVSAPVQYAAVAAFSGGPEIEAYLARTRRILKSLMSYSWRQLQQAGGRLCKPKGGFYVFPCFDELRQSLSRDRGIDTSPALCWQLLQDTGVAMLPGSAFGRSPRELALRIACVDFDGGAALKAIAKLPGTGDPDEAFLREFCQPSLRGIERLCNWLTPA
jgi:aspartate aminotransferase